MGGILDKFSYVPYGGVPIGDALFSFIKREISSGRLKAGTALPTIKALAQDAGVTFRVARCAMERLAREGYVRSRPRVGSVVLPRDVTMIHGRVLFALPDIDASSYHLTQIVDALRRRLAKAGYAFTSVVFTPDGADGFPFLKTALVHTPDLVVAMYSTPAVRECLRNAGMKCIFVYGDRPSPSDGWWIRFSVEEPLKHFVGHCVRAGVKRVVEVRFNGNDVPYAGTALKAVGIESTMMSVPRNDKLGRYEGIERSAYETFFQMPKSKFPDLFLFWDDFVAQGALTAFLKRGIDLPDDVKLVSLSNRGLGPVYPDALTRFECDPKDTGLQIAEFAVSVLAKGRMPQTPVISPSYVFGQSFPY